MEMGPICRCVQGSLNIFQKRRIFYSFNLCNLDKRKKKKALGHFYICEFQCPGEFQDSLSLCGFVVMLPLEFRVGDRCLK